MVIRCIYTDLDGTLLGRGASLFRTADGAFTLLAARALEACHRAGVEVVIKSGRRRAQVMEDARILGQTAYIFEVGSGMVIDGELSFLTGRLQPRDGKTIHRQIEETGAPALLLERYAGRLEPHDPHRRFPPAVTPRVALCLRQRAKPAHARTLRGASDAATGPARSRS